MRQLLFIPFSFILFTGYSQLKVVDVGKENVQINSTLFYTVAGSPVSTTKYVRVVSGSPYFYEDWLKGKLMLSDGRMYDSLRLKLDMIENSLLFIGKDGTEMTATVPVKGVTLTDPISDDQYHFIHSDFLQLGKNMTAGWYQVLEVGKTSMYKLPVKIITENRPYGSATTEQKISDSEQYYIYYNSAFTRIKKIKEIPELLSNKKEELNAYISSNKLSGKSDEDYAELVSYYNKLTQ